MTGTSLLRPATQAPLPPVVDALIVVHDGDRWLERALQAVATQTVRVRRLAVVLTGEGDELPPAWHGEHVLAVEARDASWPGAVRAGVRALDSEAPDRDWLWLLTDDCFPQPDALAEQLAAGRDAHVAVVGAKHVHADHPDRLVEVGVTLSRTGRRVLSPRPGELDQGQLDSRGTVLSVDRAAMLVRADLFDRVGAPDPGLPVGAATDLCWRTHQAGLQVRVAPAAVVREVGADERGLRSRERRPFDGLGLHEIDDSTYSHQGVLRERRAWERERRGAAARAVRRRRRDERAVALARSRWWQTPLLGAQIVVGGLLLAVVLLVLKRPRAALAELSDAVVPLAPWHWWGPGARGRRKIGRHPHDPDDVLAPTAVALRGVTRDLQEGLPHLVAARAEPAGDAEPGPVSEDAAYLPGEDVGARVARHPGIISAAVSLLVAVVAWWPLLAGRLAAVLDRGLVGGELLGGTGDASSAWTRYLTGWQSAGLGSAEEPPAWLPLAAGSAWVIEHLPGRTPASSVAAAGALLLVLALPAATASAYLAARAVTRDPWPRALVALAWALSPAVLVGLRDGRLGVAVLAVALPLLAAGIAACRRDPWWPAVGGTVLTAAVVGSVAPALLVLTALAGLWGVLRSHGRGRVAGAMLAVLPAVLLGPAVLGWWRRPETMLVGPGLTLWGPGPRPWTSAVLWPLEPATDPLSVLPGAPAWVAQAQPLVLVPLVLAGVCGLAVPGRRGRAATHLAVLAVGALAVAAFASRLTLGQGLAAGGGVQDVTMWPGYPLLVLTLALLAAALLGTHHLRRRVTGRAARVLGATLAGLVAVGVACQAAWIVLAGLDGRLSPAPALVPQVARDGAASAMAGRYLLLRTAGTAVSVASLPGDPAAMVRELPDARRGDEATLAIARALVTGGDPAVSDRLGDAGIGFVGLAPADPAISARLDTLGGLARLSDATDPLLWRVTPRPSAGGDPVPASVVRAVDSGGRPVAAVPVAGPGMEVDAPVPAGARRLVVAQAPGWAKTADVRADGGRLEAREDHGMSAYDLPEGARRVTVEREWRHRSWTMVQGVTAGLVALLALPFGPRRRDEGELDR